jgi:transposase-like protein
VLTLKANEQLKLDIVSRVHAGKITFQHALKILNKSESTLFRYLKNYQESGAIFALHKNKNLTPSNKINFDLEENIVRICKEKYYDFNRTHAWEKFRDVENILIPKVTFNRICSRNNILKKNVKRKKKIPRSRRERMKQTGLMIQMDGSPHKWFGHRKTCLVIAIDDANSDILYGEFSPTETTFACMNVTKNILKKHGTFQVLYVDKAGIFGKDAVDSFDAVKREGFSSLKFCLLKFGIHTVFAHSPEAKGRVERAFKTLQDRLVAEMRLAGIKTIKEANDYFNNVFLPEFRKIFITSPQEKISAFVPVLSSVNLDEQFYMIEKRVVKNDHTFSLKNKRYDILLEGSNYSGKEIEIRSYPNSKVRYFIDDKEVTIKKAEIMSA